MSPNFIYSQIKSKQKSKKKIRQVGISRHQNVKFRVGICQIWIPSKATTAKHPV
jgi:hypothetical protein